MATWRESARLAETQFRTDLTTMQEGSGAWAWCKIEESLAKSGGRQPQSPRKTDQQIKLIAAWAALHGRDKVLPADIWVGHACYLESLDSETYRRTVERELHLVRSFTDPTTGKIVSSKYPYPTLTKAAPSSEEHLSAVADEITDKIVTL